MRGAYVIYGGEFGETIAPTRHDAKVSFTIDGGAAAAVFSRLGKDLKHACLSEPGERVRARGDLACRMSSKRAYTCTYGVDLKTGKSIPGGDC